MSGNQLPFYNILYFCDGKSTVSALCISSIYRSLNKSDIVKACASRLSVKYLTNIYSEYHLLFLETYFSKIQQPNALSMIKVLDWASKNGYLDVVKYLVSFGVEVRSRSSLAIVYASENGYFEIVKYLVSVG